MTPAILRKIDNSRAIPNLTEKIRYKYAPIPKNMACPRGRSPPKPRMIFKLEEKRIITVTREKKSTTDSEEKKETKSRVKKMPHPMARSWFMFIFLIIYLVSFVNKP
jgi:hypothetical protein